MHAVPKRRAEALPYGALVMEEMIQAFGLKEVVISAYGLREGVLQRRLPPEEADKDPLIEFARELNAREARTPGHARRTVPLDDAAVSQGRRRTSAAFAKRRASSPISAGAVIPTTAPWARSRKCCAALMAAPTITSAR